jgi:drug/metabolite transporter (DMT)-like permease
MLLAPLSLVSPFEYTALLWTAILGYIFWGEVPSENLLIGAIAIIGAGLVMTYRETLKKKQKLMVEGDAP